MGLPLRRSGRFERHLVYLDRRFLGSLLDCGAHALRVELRRGTDRVQRRRSMGRRGVGRAIRGARRIRQRADQEQDGGGDATKGSHHAMLPEPAAVSMGGASAFQEEPQIDQQHPHEHQQRPQPETQVDGIAHQDGAESHAEERRQQRQQHQA